MRRVVSVLVAVPLVGVLAAIPAEAQTRAVDAETGPVAFANAASLAVADTGDGSPGGSVISETQRSPVTPGASRLGDTRSAVPASDGERAAVGPNYRIDIAGHDVTATLREDRTPRAAARSDYALTDLATGTTVLTFDESVTSAECVDAGDVRAEATTARFSLVDADGDLTPVELPTEGGAVTRQDLPFGASVELDEGEEATSDITVRRLGDFGELLRQDGWRSGDVTAVSGWLVEVETHVRPAGIGQGFELGDRSGHEDPDESQERDENDRARTIGTTLVLGGVSCSVPSGFVGGGGGTGGQDEVAPAPEAAREPEVPVTIPAGVGAPASPRAPRVAAAPETEATITWGLVLLFGGGGLGIAALLLSRPARASRDRS